MKRFKFYRDHTGHCCCDMEEVDDGKYIKYTDFQKLEAKVAKDKILAAEIEAWSFHDTEQLCSDVLRLTAKVAELEKDLENAEGYLWDAADASQWEDYRNDVPHLNSEYTKEKE